MRKARRRILIITLMIIVCVNIMAMFHAYKFTHFSTGVTEKMNSNHISAAEKVAMLFTGASLPRPVTKRLPNRSFQLLSLESNVTIDAWWMKTTESSKGAVILFHGYGGEKSGMLDRAYALLDMGYDVMLPDFMGAAGSDGYQCTIGFKEAENVKSCVAYLSSKGTQNIFLLGTSMGAAAVMRACSLQPLPVKGIMLECPFGTMRQTVRNRFEVMHVPYFPLGDILVFWGGVENGFNAFSHNPEEYAKKLRQPVLLMYGGQDDRVKRFEIDNIYHNLRCQKTLKIFARSGHESYLNDYAEEWKAEVNMFLKTCH
jgi:pimeloyl-ACP methyl ester carboxylesterase